MTKVKTINLKGKEYATVPARLAAFRKDCPYALIETLPTFMDDQIMFKARIVKDKRDPDSAEATGHAILEGKGEKVFEKLETISVGRALALLGYAASGEIASGEEMMEYYEYKEQLKGNEIEEAKSKLDSAKNIDELKTIFMSLKANKFPEVIKYKDELKTKHADIKPRTEK